MSVFSAARRLRSSLRSHPERWTLTNTGLPAAARDDGIKLETRPYTEAIVVYRGDNEIMRLEGFSCWLTRMALNNFSRACQERAAEAIR